MRVHAQILAGGLALLLTSVAAWPANLVEVYEQALRNDPLIREAEANRLATLEARPQARANWLPQLVATGSIERSDSERSQIFMQQVDPLDPNSAVVPVNFTTRADGVETTAYSIRLTQSVFRWDRWVALRRADREAARAEIDYRAAEQDLMARVAQRYFDVLAAQDTVEAAEAALEAFERQLEQQEKRFEVGLVAITDVQEARAARDQASATLIAAKRQLATAREFLREITGEPIAELQGPGPDMPLQTPIPDTEDAWVQSALDQNLALLSARLASEIAREDVRSARAGHLPTVDLVVSHSLSEDRGDQVTTRGNVSSMSPADMEINQDVVALQFNVPIYSGGATSSRVRQAVYQHRAARERLERTARETEREARDSYLGVLSEISRVRALRQALESSQTALQATEAGFEVGTRTTVDVLDARRRLFEAQTNYARSRYDYIINVVRLKRAAGTLSAEDLEEVNGWLME